MYLIAIIISTIIFSVLLIGAAYYLTFAPKLTVKVNRELFFNSILNSIWTTIIINFGVANGNIKRIFLGRTVLILITIIGDIVISKLLVIFMK